MSRYQNIYDMNTNILLKDPEFRPYAAILKNRNDRIISTARILSGDKDRISDNCNSYLYYGLHKTASGWIFREWAPHAKNIYIIGDFNNWRKDPRYAMQKIGKGEWEIRLSKDRLSHGSLYRLLTEWEMGWGERLPSHAVRCVQDPYTKIFSAEVWDPPRFYEMRNPGIKSEEPPLIYETHIGMSSEYRRISTFTEFRTFVLPRIIDLGYNTLQIMGIQEHPYYGSFGYQVSNFFAVSSRFGTPDELKELIDAAHGSGIRVIMDLVHSHAVANETEGLGKFDGTYDQFFYPGEKGYHPLWKSRCFDYGKHRVLHFLLSNCKYWLEEFRFDGFRFDGVTSMIYLNHGINTDFTSYAQYYDGNQDENAIVYLGVANMMIHQINPDAVTIAEDMSGMPGMALPVEEGGIGFDYRLGMGVPDYWIKIVKEKKDEEWHVGDMFYQLTDKRVAEKCIDYVESHDQALVGDKTLFFRLADKDTYYSMGISEDNLRIERAMALHKMIRLVTIGTAGDGYMNFMGNEWGHPEWIDFPRAGNGWSYEHARRQWSLVDDDNLKFRFLNAFDKSMIAMVKKYDIFKNKPRELIRDIEKQILVFERGNLLFVFNFNPLSSHADYTFDAPPGKYVSVLDTDSRKFLGFGRIDEKIEHFTRYQGGNTNILSLYIPSRTGFVLKRN